MANLPVPAPLNEADYEAIEGAVMETARGRWFLAEYARRNRHADTTMLLKALDRIEATIGGKNSVEPVDRIRFDLVEMSKAIARTKTEIAAMKPDADHHGKFGEASEELELGGAGRPRPRPRTFSPARSASRRSRGRCASRGSRARSATCSMPMRPRSTPPARSRTSPASAPAR